MRGFAEKPDLLLLLDDLGRRYGRLPHEILSLTPWQISLAMQCREQADATSAQLINRLTGSGNMVFPVVNLKP